jgi:hypothetical protein
VKYADVEDTAAKRVVIVLVTTLVRLSYVQIRGSNYGNDNAIRYLSKM